MKVRHAVRFDWRRLGTRETPASIRRRAQVIIVRTRSRKRPVSLTHVSLLDTSDEAANTGTGNTLGRRALPQH